MIKSNESLQQDVQNAIKWEPLLNAAEIGVIAKDGVVTLSGIVNTYSKKIQAEDAAKNTAGVKAVVENIEIRFDNAWLKSDADVANEVLNAFKWNWAVPSEKIKIKVEDGWVSLEGELEWNYQKDAAKTAINNLPGVKGVRNYIKIKSEVHDAIEKKAVEQALTRNWAIDDRNIQVKVDGNNVILQGKVGSLYQKDEAGRIAWNAPGVWTVENELLVEYNN